MKTKGTRLTTSIPVGTPMHDWYYSMNERQRSIVVQEALLNHFLLKTGQQQPAYPPMVYPQFPQPVAYPGWPAVAPAPAVPPPVAPVAAPAAPQPAIPAPAQVAPVSVPVPVIEQPVAPTQVIEEPKLSEPAAMEVETPASEAATVVKRNLIAGFRS